MYQRTEVIGHLGRDPEMRYTPNGQAVTTFSVATTRRWTGQDGQPQEKTTWFRVTAWGKLGELCNQYLSKGRLVLVEGEVDASAWMGQDGQPRATLELRARDVRFLGGPGQTGETEVTAMRDRPGVEEEEIPF
ncbi:MAG: single-stranded DNA-binding protein [Anaerolineae bacterium]|nr:single-stranded DNA-binding protein [Caldilineales bacterium]MCX7852261.1 single-stranded DNA-binding protein [Caldilineales bacterium]MDW8267704.1 single-stranded DNA-binding protein [Anaerolineae bacterium]